MGHLEGWYLDPRSVHFFTKIQEFWTHTSIAGLSNSASAATPQRRIAWLLVMALMIAMSVCFRTLVNRISVLPGGGQRSDFLVIRAHRVPDAGRLLEIVFNTRPDLENYRVLGITG